MNFIDTKQFSALVTAGAIKSVTVAGTAGGFMIEADGRIIETKAGRPRVFRKLHTAAAYLKGKGIGKFEVDTSRWNPEQRSIM